MQRIGFIGVGNMGCGMATNLIRNLARTQQQTTSRVFVYDAFPTSVENFLGKIANVAQCEKEGVAIEAAQSIQELASQSDVVLLSLPSEKICNEVIFGSGGVAEVWKDTRNSSNISSHRAIIDHGTFSHKFSITNSHKLQALVSDATYIDAPVSGGPTGANDGTLTIMCGGDEKTYAKFSPLLQCMGSNILYFGESGAGTAAKLVNQCLVTAHAQAAAEAIHMAESFNLIDLGTRKKGIGDKGLLDTKKEERLIAMLSSSWGQSKVLDLLLHDYVTAKTKEGESAAPSPVDMFPPTGAPLRNLHKDMQCATSDLERVIAARTVMCKNVNNEPIDVTKEYPVFSTSAAQVATACHDRNEKKDKGVSLSNGPFLSLIQLLRPSNHN